MKILVLGGMHGNEMLGIELVREITMRPIEHVDVVLGNEQAIAAGSRYSSQDLNRSFPGDKTSNIYESKRAYELVIKAMGYDIVLDFHNTGFPGNDCGFVGETAKPLLYDVAGALGLKRIIVADYDCMNKYATNCLSVEISVSSELNDCLTWYERIAMLARTKSIESESVLEKYRFVYRMTLDDRDQYGLDAKDFVAFEPVEEGLVRQLGVEPPAYPIFVSDRFTPYNFGGLLNKIVD